MKINKYISIDYELFHKLQRENNASSIINDLVKEHYNLKDIENIDILRENLYKIKQINKENRKKEKELRLKIDKIEAKNKLFFDNFKKSYPEELIDKLKRIENLDYEAAVDLAKAFDLPRRGIGGIKLIKIWEEIKNGMAMGKK